MVKLLLCLLSALALAAAMLQLRQQRMEINYQASQIHRQIHDSQSRLWNQQLQIAIFTAPNAITATVGNHDLSMVPRAPLPPAAARWIDVRNNPDAQ